MYKHGYKKTSFKIACIKWAKIMQCAQKTLPKMTNEINNIYSFTKKYQVLISQWP